MKKMSSWGVLAIAMMMGGQELMADERILPPPPELVGPDVIRYCLKSESALASCVKTKKMGSVDIGAMDYELLAKDAEMYSSILRAWFPRTSGWKEECNQSIANLKQCLKSKMISMEDFLKFYPVIYDVDWSRYRERIASLTEMTDNKSARCEGDSLGQEQALGRNLWAQKCAPGMMAYKGAPADPDNLAKEMLQQMILGVGKGRAQYVTFMQAVRLDSGAVVLKRTSDWKAPAPALSEATMKIEDLQKRNEVGRKELKEKIDALPCDIPQDWVIAQVCTAGCYTPDQVVEFIEGQFEIASGKADSARRVVTLAKKASLDRLKFSSQEVEGIVQSETESKHQILDIETKSGKKISVTLDHPMVMFSGQIQPADTLKVGDELVSKEGNAEPIVKLSPRLVDGKVYNIQIASTDKNANIIVAQGLLNGSIYYQNEGTKHLNRLLFRSKIPTKLK